jgi:hypothetical protein
VTGSDHWSVGGSPAVTGRRTQSPGRRSSNPRRSPAEAFTSGSGCGLHDRAGETRSPKPAGVFPAQIQRGVGDLRARQRSQGVASQRCCQPWRKVDARSRLKTLPSPRQHQEGVPAGATTQGSPGAMASPAGTWLYLSTGAGGPTGWTRGGSSAKRLITASLA